MRDALGYGNAFGQGYTAGVGGSGRFCGAARCGAPCRSGAAVAVGRTGRIRSTRCCRDAFRAAVVVGDRGAGLGIAEAGPAAPVGAHVILRDTDGLRPRR